MKKLNLKMLLLLMGVLVIGGVIVGCGDDDVNNISLQDFITTTEWYLVAIEQSSNPKIDINGDGVVDHKDNQLEISKCNEDNQFFFKKDGTYEVNSFSIACDGQKPYSIIKKGTWHIYGKKFIVTYNDTEDEFYSYRLSLPIKDKNSDENANNLFELKKKKKINDTEYTLTYVFVDKILE